MAIDPNGISGRADRTVLPPPEPPFNDAIDIALTDSTGAFPEPLRAPAGAPNVLLVMGDDIGHGHMSAFGRPADAFDVGEDWGTPISPSTSHRSGSRGTSSP